MPNTDVFFVPTELNGRAAHATYLMDDFTVAKDQESATLVKVIFDDNVTDTKFLRPVKDARPGSSPSQR
jgi:hypothetical protein